MPLRQVSPPRRRFSCFKLSPLRRAVAPTLEAGWGLRPGLQRTQPQNLLMGVWHGARTVAALSAILGGAGAAERVMESQALTQQRCE